MQTKNDLIDFVMGEYMLNGNDLYRIGSGMQLTPEQDDNKAATLRAAFDHFKAKNEKITGGAPMIPDSLYRSYAPK